MLGRIPRIRHIAFSRKIQRALEGPPPAAVVLLSRNFSGYFGESIEWKIRHPKRPLIQYSPELWIPGEKRAFRQRDCSYYTKHASLPDMIIDVEQHRGEIRKQAYGIRKTVHIIPNTLPLKAMPSPAHSGALAKVAGVSLPEDRRILVFTGLVTPTVIAELSE
ncbi:MAG: hypothetical protein GY852_01745, partial [bacterium]|nr:hypothetical protein [bacterium]